MAVEQMKELVTFLARALVDAPEKVDVQVYDNEKRLTVELFVEEDDLGKIIGRDGRTARALRTLVASTAAKYRRRALLQIVE